MGWILGFSSRLDKSLNQGHVTIILGKPLTKTYYDKPGVLSPRDLVFRPDLSDINWTIIISLKIRQIMLAPQFTFVKMGFEVRGLNNMDMLA